MTITINLPSEIETALRKKATDNGKRSLTKNLHRGNAEKSRLYKTPLDRNSRAGSEKFCRQRNDRRRIGRTDRKRTASDVGREKRQTELESGS